MRLPRAQADPTKSTAPLIAQPSQPTVAIVNTRAPTSLSTVGQSARWVRSTSSPASASGTSPRAVARASITASTTSAVPMT